MSKSKLMERLLQTTIVAGAMAAAAPALAQETAQSGDGAPQDVITVTGSRIQRDGNLVETSPVTQIGAAEFDERGVVRVEDVINTLPQAFGAQGSTVVNGGTGTASLNLRGLGSNRTLVLINGRRMPYGSINIAAPDVNFVPAQLIQNVDVLTGGASATYGSDAVAGVVNFVLDTDFEGFRIDGNLSSFQHNNNSDTFQDLLSGYQDLNPSQFRVPNGSTWDGAAVDVTAIIGGEFGEGRGHATAYVGYQNQEEVLQDGRDYSQCALGTSGGEFTCSGSSTNQFTNILDFAGLLPTGTSARVDPTNDTFIARDGVTDTFNFNPYNHYIRPSERYQFGAFADYELTDSVDVYTELMFMDNRTNAQIAPSGVFGYGVAGDNGGINCDNPFLSDQQVEFICGSRGLDPADDPEGDGFGPVAGVGDILFLRRNVEGGNRNQDIRHTTYRGVVGLRGEIGDTGLSWDVSGMYSNVHRADVYNNDLSIINVSNALYAVTDPDTGDTVCKINVDSDPVNDDASCAPYDIFSGAGPSRASLDYVVSPLNRDGTVEQVVVSGVLSGTLEEVGVVSPFADEAVAFAVGAEYRRDRLDSNPDRGFQTGDGAGQGGPTTPIEGAQDVYELFVELNVPILQNKPFAEQLGIDGAFRTSSYTNSSVGVQNTSFSAESYKIGADWAPIADVRFRGSYQRAVRAPNIFDLFDAQSIGLFDLDSYANGLYDPCAGDLDATTATPAPFYTAAQCANTGVSSTQYGTIVDNPAGQFNALFGGNPDLDPEKADTYTIGVVIEPEALDGFILSVDYFNIEVDGFIGTVPQQVALDECATTGDEYFCGLINRGNGATLWANQTGFIQATNLNTGSLATSGIDVLSTYSFAVANAGDVTLDFVGTWLDDLSTEPIPGFEPYNCVGFYAGRCGTPNPEWRHKFSARWDTTFGLGLTATWRYFDNVTQEGDDSGDPDFALGDQTYIDLSARYELNDSTRLRVGVNNVFDKIPPISSVAGTAPGNGNTYPTVYDALGRYFFVGATVDF
ncbi:TonB-dependent receptor domain-containing protein [Parvularcula dongshanensis]|uniref:Outer membrane receptor protein involved in Fe transport n=1 Tax=Parvularcula dongshanensis TaxID=1173995 RepID=A0A840I6G7_9PROT|nr:TonB-dependent receptor [Parvularcula dongshanensis]MBB4659774.1 outer membrane receptor protein involved in Fe transport [Parvularcula dongshanensis]